jgi:hypothetical protein
VQAYKQALAVDTTYASAYTGLFEALSHLGRTRGARAGQSSSKAVGRGGLAAPGSACSCCHFFLKISARWLFPASFHPAICQQETHW